MEIICPFLHNDEGKKICNGKYSSFSTLQTHLIKDGYQEIYNSDKKTCLCMVSAYVKDSEMKTICDFNCKSSEGQAKYEKHVKAMYTEKYYCKVHGEFSKADFVALHGFCKVNMDSTTSVRITCNFRHTDKQDLVDKCKKTYQGFEQYQAHVLRSHLEILLNNFETCQCEVYQDDNKQPELCQFRINNGPCKFYEHIKNTKNEQHYCHDCHHFFKPRNHKKKHYKQKADVLTPAPHTMPEHCASLAKQEWSGTCTSPFHPEENDSISCANTTTTTSVSTDYGFKSKEYTPASSPPSFIPSHKVDISSLSPSPTSQCSATSSTIANSGIPGYDYPLSPSLSSIFNIDYDFFDKDSIEL